MTKMGSKRTLNPKPLKPTSKKTTLRNKEWRKIVLERAEYLIGKYGFIVCEYSGESIQTLSSMGEDINDGWGHHIDRDRNHCTPENCYIVKYKWHRDIDDHNIVVSQEDFETRKLFL